MFYFGFTHFFKLINLEEVKKKEIVILCCLTIFQRVFSYNLYFLKVGEKNSLKVRFKKKNKKTRKKQVLF